MIKDFTPRLYQETIFATAAEKNTLVVLPTGMGKTNIFLMLASQRLKNYPQSKILFLGPTRPLIDQYKTAFEEHFDLEPEKLTVFTGHVPPEKREELWKTATIIFSTPQGLENDIINKRIDLREVSLLGFDEAHRAVGDYAYVWIAKQYTSHAKYPRILGLTASPGTDLEKINEVCRNLFIEAIEVRTDKDPDVASYIQDINVQYVKVTLPEEFNHIHKFLKDCFTSKLAEAYKYGILSKAVSGASKTDLLRAQAQLQAQLAQGSRDYDVMRSVSLLAEALKVEHALELVETQGIDALYSYMQELFKKARTTKVKAVQNLVKDLNFRSAYLKCERLFKEGVEHPKLDAMRKIVSEESAKKKDAKFIVFTQYRDSAQKIVQVLEALPGVSARLFVGQQKKKGIGLSQKKQKEILDTFREGGFTALVATSVAEEGLDIPRVDSVIFYEPIPSAIRNIQRRGRTGRQAEGKVFVLMAKGTRDEGYRWSAHHKEKRMHKTLEALQKQLNGEHAALALSLQPGQPGSAPSVGALNTQKQGYLPTLHTLEPHQQSQQSLDRFVEQNREVKIFADFREKGSGVIKALVEIGIDLSLVHLESADYLCSEHAGVEYKTAEDFVNSLIDGRLLQQLRKLKERYSKPLVIVEGVQDIYSIRNVHPNAIRGMLATIAVSYGIPLLFTKNVHETASLLAIIARREQESGGRDFSMHSNKKPLTLREQQEYVVSALPGVGPAISKPLLRRFGSVKGVINATEEELQEVELVGKKKSRDIRQVVDEPYREV